MLLVVFAACATVVMAALAWSARDERRREAAMWDRVDAEARRRHPSSQSVFDDEVEQ